MPDPTNDIYIGVIGAGHCTGKLETTAYELGQHIAKANAVMVCGGLDGVMKAAAEGVRSEKGISIGIIPGNDRSDANRFIDYVVCSGVGEARNIQIIKTADVVIALSGKYGTLSELGFALKLNKPVISLGSWEIDETVINAKNPKEAVQLALQAIKR